LISEKEDSLFEENFDMLDQLYEFTENQENSQINKPKLMNLISSYIPVMLKHCMINLSTALVI